MKVGKLSLTLLFLLLFVGGAKAQFSLSRVQPAQMETVKMRESIKMMNITNSYDSPTKALAEKIKLRQQRNYVDISSSFQLTQVQFENWAGGGDNTFTGRATFNFLHRYTRDKFSIEYWLRTRYGINVIDGEPFKNEDEFQLGTKVSWKIINNWSYATDVNMRSQFTNGYASRTNETRVSAFMSPGYVTASVGLNYKTKNNALVVYVSPVAGSMNVVISDTLSRRGVGGIPSGEHTKRTFGGSAKITYKKSFIKNKFSYSAYMQSFVPYKQDNKANTIRLEQKLDIRATNYFTTNLYLLTYYDENAKTPDNKLVQCKYSIGMGLSYSFKR